MSRALEAALEYRNKYGWNVVAAPAGKKLPVGKWKQWQTENVPEREIRAWFGGEGAAGGEPNIFLITGAVSRLAVLDCDDRQALDYWKERLGQEPLASTTRVKTGGGWHFYWQLAEGQVERGRSSSGGNSGKWDLRAEGGGVIAPPSVHESGREYVWSADRGPDSIKSAPAALFDRGEDAGNEESDGGRSLLAHLLTNIPGEGGRNVWLAKVAGHYAKAFPFKDAFDAMVRQAAGTLQPELPEVEIAKLIDSIWSSEQAKKGKEVTEPEEGEEWRKGLVEPAEDTGWLVSGGTRILVQVKNKKQDGFELGLAEWMNGDIHVIGVVRTDRGLHYEVEMHRPDGQVMPGALPASTLSDVRRLNAWLAEFEVNIAPPANESPKQPICARLQRYLVAQDAEVMESVPALGWHDASRAFITHEGVIRADSHGPYESIRPDPELRNWAPYRYGHKGQTEAARILAEILTFHYPSVTAVFSSWWAACLLKPQISELSSQFPFMALEAPSESGKTTGFFPLMLQLAGSSAGQTNPTMAALRDYLTAHRSGIVWVDDLDNLDAHGELLRNVTVGGTLIKKSSDYHGQTTAELRSALVITGEHLGLNDQKALRDRAVRIEVPSPTTRVSLHEDQPQWEDILELRRRHPDLTDYAGSIVQLALQQIPKVRRLKQYRPEGTGRLADTVAIVQLGARVLDGMLSSQGGAGWVIREVERWADNQDFRPDNTLTLKLLPEALARTGWLDTPRAPDPSRRQVATPAFYAKSGIVWFSPRSLAQWWSDVKHGRVDPRVETQQAIEDQARSLGLGGKRGVGRRFHPFVDGGGKQGQIYWRLDEEHTRVVVARSQNQDINDQEPEQQELGGTDGDD